jgi:hypothetical protein
MLNQTVYVRGGYVLAQRLAHTFAEAHPLDAHMGRHRVIAVCGDELVIRPLHARGDAIQVPAAAVWLACDSRVVA